MTAHGFGRAIESETVRAPWAAALLGPGVVVRVAPRVALWLEPDVVVALTRPAFEVGHSQGLFRAGIGGGRAMAGLEVRLP